MTDEAPEKPGDGTSHRRRRRSRGTRGARPSGRSSILSRLGRHLSRRGKLAVCLAIAGASVGLSGAVRWLETPDVATSPTLVSAVAFWPAVFVIVLAIGALALAEAVGYKRKRLWLTTMVLIVYLVLHAITWHRASAIVHDGLEPQIVGSFDAPNPLPPATPGAIDLYILWLYTIGTLSVISTLVLMRKLVRWGTPSSGSLRERRATAGAEEDTSDTRDEEPAEADEDGTVARSHGLPVPREVEPSELDDVPMGSEPAVPRPDAPPPDESSPDERATPRRRKPMFE